MYYATKTQTVDATGIVQKQALAFYSRADRAAWLAANGGQAISAAENRRLKDAGVAHTVSDKGLGIVFFSRIVD